MHERFAGDPLAVAHMPPAEEKIDLEADTMEQRKARESSAIFPPNRCQAVLIARLTQERGADSLDFASLRLVSRAHPRPESIRSGFTAIRSRSKPFRWREKQPWGWGGMVDLELVCRTADVHS